MSEKPTFLPYVPCRPTLPRFQHLSVVRHQDHGHVVLSQGGGSLVVGDRIVNTPQHRLQTPTHGEPIINGGQLEEIYSKQPLCGADVVDVLLREPEHFPDNWKHLFSDGRVPMYFALGTIYGEYVEGIGRVLLYARGVYWSDDRVHEVIHRLDHAWYDDLFAMVLNGRVG